MNLLLEVNPNETLNFFDALGYGGQTVLLGMGAVFSVLIVIWAALALLKVFMHDIPNKKQAEPVTVSEPVVPPTVMGNSSDDELVAVIAAAIAMAESDSGGAKFRVVSFRRK